MRYEIEGKVKENRETFLSELKNIPGILNASGIGQSIGGNGRNMISIDQWEGKPLDYNKSFEMRAVDYGLIEMLGINMVNGRRLHAIKAALTNPVNSLRAE